MHISTSWFYRSVHTGFIFFGLHDNFSFDPQVHHGFIIFECATENYILEHAQKHLRLQTISIYKKGSTYVPDHRTNLSIFKTPYWRRKNSDYEFIKNIVPKEYMSKGRIKCRFCDLNYQGKASVDEVRFRSNFAVTIIRQERAAHDFLWRWGHLVRKLRRKQREQLREGAEI